MSPCFSGWEWQGLFLTFRAGQGRGTKFSTFSSPKVENEPPPGKRSIFSRNVVQYQQKRSGEHMLENRTIAAIATPPGQGGIAVVRLSGPESYPIAERVFRPMDSRKRVRSVEHTSELQSRFDSV